MALRQSRVMIQIQTDLLLQRICAAVLVFMLEFNCFCRIKELKMFANEKVKDVRKLTIVKNRVFLIKK